jgi:hypothetical protein
MIVDRLQKHVDGKHEMTATQIQAARILLDRTVPVLKATEVNINANDIKDITHLQGAGLIQLLEGEATTLAVNGRKVNGGT